MVSKPVVLLDLDNTLCDYSKAFIATSRKLFQKPPRDTKLLADWHLDKCGIWTLKECNRIVAYTKGIRNFWETLERVPQSGELLRNASKLNLFFATACYQTDGADIATQRSEWLFQQFGIRDAFVIPERDKAKIAKDIDAEWAIDDRIENVLAIAEAVPGCRVYLYTAPYEAVYHNKLTDPRIKKTASINEFIGDILNANKRTT